MRRGAKVFTSASGASPDITKIKASELRGHAWYRVVLERPTRISERVGTERSSWRRKKAMAGVGGHGGAGRFAVHAELAVDVLDVPLDLAGAHDQIVGDLGVAQAGGNQSND